jgi:hypothetical protein
VRGSANLVGDAECLGQEIIRARLLFPWDLESPGGCGARHIPLTFFQLERSAQETQLAFQILLVQGSESPLHLRKSGPPKEMRDRAATFEKQAVALRRVLE